MARVQSVQSVESVMPTQGGMESWAEMLADSHREMRYFNVTTTNTADLTITITRGA